MTLDEAIQRENKIAEENQKIVDTQIVFDDVSISELYCDDTEVIEEHLSNCKNCEKTFNSMKENIDSKKIEETKDIDFLKKFSRRFKIVRGILVIILLIFVVIIGRRTIILSNINSKFNKVTTANSDNFYMKSTTYTENQALIVETYNKSDKYLTKTSLWDNGELVTKLTYYKAIALL